MRDNWSPEGALALAVEHVRSAGGHGEIMLTVRDGAVVSVRTQVSVRFDAGTLLDNNATQVYSTSVGHRKTASATAESAPTTERR